MEKLLGFTVWDQSVDDLVDSIIKEAKLHQPLSIRNAPQTNPYHHQYEVPACLYASCINPHSYCEAQTDFIFKDALQHSTWLIPDGVGIIIGSKILGGKISRRVTGWDLFTTLLGRLNAQGVYRIFLLGSSEEVLKLMTARLSRDYPSIIVAGTMSPPYKPVFSDDDNQHMVKTINAAKPDLLWVAMTAPKQEKWLYENRGALQVPFAGAVGAVFDFYSGTIHRPNRFFQLIGLEWLPRLLQEPKRLRKRMTVSAPRFLFAIFKVWMTKNKFMH